MKKLIQSGFSGIAMAALASLAQAHEGHGALLMHLHAEEWALIGIVFAAVAFWLLKRK